MKPGPLPQESDTWVEDEVPHISTGRKAIRLGLMTAYLAAAVAAPVYVSSRGMMVGTMQVFTWLMTFYLAARALAFYVKYRQETRPPRYSRAYVEGRDLDAAPPSNPQGSNHG